ncbi:Aspartic proteinase CDR1 [Capsicum chinense]|nr:Aspartic proteinase CDR1 [Capsicum chinense]
MVITTKGFTLFLRFVLLSFFYLYLVSFRESVSGFTVDLIHRDSPLSPFYDSSNTPYERLRNAVHQSSSRASLFKKTCVSPIRSTLTASDGEYLMKISIGTPPVDAFVILDTGDLSVETFRFASTSGKHVSIPKIAFGCGHNNSGLSNTTSGLIGLAGGDVSIVNQMHQEIKAKFSYCLIPMELLSIDSNATSHISFGDNAVVSGPGVVSTPLIPGQSLYYLTLESISIGNKILPFKSSKISSNTQEVGERKTRRGYNIGIAPSPIRSELGNIPPNYQFIASI